MFAHRRSSGLVISHPGSLNPVVSPGFARAGRIFELASFDGVPLQIFGMKMFFPYPYELLYPLLQQGVEHFGANHLLWGSNYPVVGDDADWHRDLQLLLGGGLFVPEESIAEIAEGNPRRFWFGKA